MTKPRTRGTTRDTDAAASDRNPFSNLADEGPVEETKDDDTDVLSLFKTIAHEQKEMHTAH